MKDTGLSGDYVLWLKDEFVYKYVLELFFPLVIINLLLWYLLFFLDQTLLTILVYLGYLVFSVVRFSFISAAPKGRSIAKPVLASSFLFSVSFCSLFACLFTEVRGGYSGFFWGDERYRPLSWAFLMSGAFGLVYLGTGYLKSTLFIIKEGSNE